MRITVVQWSESVMMTSSGKCRSDALAVLLAVAGMLTMSSAIGGIYNDAISINLVSGSSATVSGSQSTPQGGSHSNWINMTVGHNAVNSAASADGSGFTSETFTPSPPITATGAGLGSFRIDLYDGGWGMNTAWNDVLNGTNTLGRAGISNGDMPNNWGPTALGINAGAVPSVFADAGYDIYALGGPVRNAGTSLTWVKMNAEVLYTNDPPAYALNSQGWRSVAAIQILKLAPIIPDMNVLGTNSILVTNNAHVTLPEGTDFGHQIENSMAITNTFVITNSGAGTLYLTDPSIVQLTGETNYFSVNTDGTATNIAVDSSTSFKISFNPVVVGIWTGIVTITNSDTNKNPYCFSVQGIVVPAMGLLGINHASITNGDVTPDLDDGTDFGTINISFGSRSRVFTVTNAGPDVLHLNGTSTIAVSGPNADDFAVTMQPSPTNIAAGSSVSFTVSFVPTSKGLRQASISIANSDVGANPYSFSIQGTSTYDIEPLMAVKGTNSVVITNNDDSASIADGTDFGSAYTNAALSHVFSITNIGTGALYLNGADTVAVSGTHSNDFTVTVKPSSTNLPVEGGITFTVQFHPSDLGIRHASISIANNDTNANPYVFSIQGTGAAVPFPAMTVLGIDLLAITNGGAASVAAGTDFGNLSSNATLSHVFTITNSGTGPLYLTGLPTATVGGALTNDFSVSVQPASTNIAATNATIFTVRFNPAGLGIRTAIISIANSDNNANPYVFDVQGMATGPGAMYSDAISINLANGAGGTVSSLQATPQGGSLEHWMNMAVPGNNAANSRASADNSGWTSTTFDSALTATGAGLGSFALQFYNGGWTGEGLNTAWNDAANDANTQGRSGLSNGDMPSGWGPTGLGIEVQNMPASFLTNGYDVYALGGTTRNSGSELSWVKMNTNGLLFTSNSPSLTFNSQGWRSVAAVQILRWDPLPAIANELKPPDLRPTSAFLSGELFRVGGGPAEVWVYYGLTDGGTDKNLWSTNFYFGFASPGSYSHYVSSLPLNSSYYFRYYSSNSYGDSWAITTTNFMTQGGTSFIVR